MIKSSMVPRAEFEIEIVGACGRLLFAESKDRRAITKVAQALSGRDARISDLPHS